MGGSLVREARRRAGLTQAQLAARVGTTQSAIARLERGATSPSFDRVLELLRACGFDLQVRLVPNQPEDWAMVEANLALTPEERLDRLRKAVAFVAAGRRAMEEQRVG